MTLENILDRMFAVHNKKPMQLQYEEYMNIFKVIGVNASEKVFVHVRDEEDRFPTIKQLWAIIHALGVYKKQKQKEGSFEDCYFCNGTGYIPYLISPKRDNRVLMYTTEVYACKCSAGQSLPSDLPRYFNIYKDVQFKPIEDFSYPLVVTINQNKFNDIWRTRDEKVSTNYSKDYRGGNKENRASLLKTKVKEITEVYAENENGA